MLSTTEFWQLLVDRTLLSLGKTVAIPTVQVDLDTEDGLHAAIDANATGRADESGILPPMMSVILNTRCLMDSQEES